MNLLSFRTPRNSRLTVIATSDKAMVPANADYRVTDERKLKFEIVYRSFAGVTEVEHVQARDIFKALVTGREQLQRRVIGYESQRWTVVQVKRTA